MIIWLSSEDPKSPRGDHFQVLQMQLPLPEKLEMIRCSWGDACRSWSSPQTSNESASTSSNKYIGWIMIFWPSSEDPNSSQGNPFQVWQMKLPLKEKWEMIRCAWGYGCRRWSGPHSSNESASTLSNEYIGCIMIFWPSSDDQNSLLGDPFQVWKMQLPLSEKWEMIRCAWGDGCRTRSGPHMSNETASTLSNK